MNLRLPVTRMLLLPVVLLALFSHHVYPEGSLWDTSLGLLGLLLLVLAMGGRIWANAYVLGRKERVLVTQGPYRIVRNPLYFFSLLGFIGAGLAFESLVLAGLFAAVFFISHWPTILCEEEDLARLFGEEYEAYRRRVPRLLPGLPPGGPKGGLRDSLVVHPGRFGAALRDCLAIPLVFVVADMLEWAKLSEIIPVLIELP